jgi:hypothetical protein
MPDISIQIGVAHAENPTCHDFRFPRRPAPVSALADRNSQ